MILKKNMIGKHILLRTAEERDAGFILKLRLDPGLNKFLHETDPSVEKQKNWIAERRGSGNDLHMIIQAQDGMNLGVVAIYNIDWNKKTFEWGRWVIVKGAPVYAAVEATILVYRTAFEQLGLELATLSVTKANKKVVRFHRNYGAKEVGEDEENVYFNFSRNEFCKILNKYKW